MSVTVKNIGALLRAAEESMKPVNKYLIQILLVVGMTTCMVITCFQTMTIIMQKSDYGIMYANGFSNTDLIVIVFMENVIKMVLALLILFPIMLLLSRSVFTSSYQDRYTIYTILFNNIGWKLILIGMGMTILSSIIPVATIKKYTPVELIGGAAS
jgi:ABC-type antimicrobial peptide transport system permease subunit